MKNFFKTFLPEFIVAAVITVALCVGILYTLTYTAVPLQAQHLWYAKDLHTYLTFQHASMTCALLFSYIFIFVYGIFDYRHTKKMRGPQNE